MILLREFLIVFSGNEFSIGIILANWTILEAFGCFFIGNRIEYIKKKIEAFVVLNILFSYSLPVIIYLIRILKNILGISVGENIGIIPVLSSSFLLLAPVSISHGASFTFGCKIYSSCSGKEAPSIGRVYVYETTGTIIGGIVWTYLLIPFFNSFQVSIGLGILNLLFCLFLLLPSVKDGKFYQKAITVITSVSLFLGIYLLVSTGADKLHRFSIKRQWKAQKILHYQNSIYGNICVTESQSQYTFFLNGVPAIITPVPDTAFVEEFVHIPLLSHPHPKDVLVISGGAGGVINEILKHPSVELIEYVELDPLVLHLIQKFSTPLTENELKNEKVKVKYIDGRLFLKTTGNKYDVIFVGILEPSDLQTNRFFTKEFFSLAKKKLKKNGLLVSGIPGSFTYFPEELKNLSRCIFNTIKSTFSHIRVIPGEGTTLFLASNEEIRKLDRTTIINLLYERNLHAEIPIPWYIEHKLNPEWERWFLDSIQGNFQKFNYDFKPVGVFYTISYWNAIFAPYISIIFRWFERINLQMVFALFVLFVSIFFLLWRKKARSPEQSIPLCIATTGFAGMIFDLVLIFAFQSIYGYVFFWIGLLVTSFMTGTALGAGAVTSVLDRIKNDLKLFIGIELSIILFSLTLPFIFILLHPYLDSPSVSPLFKGLFLLFSFLGGFLISLQFPIANQIYLRYNRNLSRTAGFLYSADLMGGWLAGILGGIFLLPVLGLFGVCIVVVLLKLSSFIVLTYGYWKNG